MGSPIEDLVLEIGAEFLGSEGPVWGGTFGKPWNLKQINVTGITDIFYPMGRGLVIMEGPTSYTSSKEKVNHLYRSAKIWLSFTYFCTFF